MARDYPGGMATLMSVLVVGDDELRRRLRGLLEKPSIKVVDAAKLEQAVAAAEHIRFDLLICAERMPDGDGLGLVERLRGERPALKAIVVSSQTSEARRQRARQAGAALVCEPVTARQLAAAAEAAYRS